MSEYEAYGCIVWPVENLEEESHVTILFLGEKDKLDTTPEKLVEFLSIPRFKAPGFVKATRLEVFGSENKTIVLTIDEKHPSLVQGRYTIKEGLSRVLGISDASSFPDYRPHISLGNPANISSVREVYYLKKPELWWGGKHYQIG
jgi:2'-5' RNA ligase